MLSRDQHLPMILPAEKREHLCTAMQDTVEQRRQHLELITLTSTLAASTTTIIEMRPSRGISPVPWTSHKPLSSDENNITKRKAIETQITKEYESELQSISVS